MKKLSKIFLAVVALVAYSCATDATEDLAVELGNAKQTTFTLSLEESRTQLGEKVDGFYPLAWSEGDKISINGVESAEAVISESNPANATFTTDASLTAPYCIAYPAAPAGEVLFAANQTHAGNGSFGSGVSTMYGYGESTGLSLNHLTGVLKIGVTGSAKVLFAQISTVDRAPIAGAFALDFESGELTPTAASKYVVDYSFGEGVVLSDTPTYIHAAVPAGAYDELYVTLFDVDGGVMYATVKAGYKKPLAVGTVREFSNHIAYAPNAEVFVIKDKASLKAFAEQAATLEKDVLFVKDVDMTGEEWTPITGYTGTINGNGYAIKGMTLPLFESTSATIKGLHLRDVNIVSTDRVHVGSIACDFSGIMSHCSATGTIEQNNTTYNATAVGGYNDVNIGGIVGHAVGATVTHCTNEVDITIKSFADPTVSYASLAGGIVAGAKGGCTFSYLTNKGDITFAATAHKGNIYISGVVGREIDIADQIDMLEISNCENYGAITTTKESKTSNDILIAGITGYVIDNADLKCDNLKNYGPLSAYGVCKSLRLNGIFTYRFYINGAKNWENAKSAKITIDGATASSINTSGLGGEWQGVVDNFANHADITVTNVSGVKDINVSGLLCIGSNGKKSNLINNGNLTLGDGMTFTGIIKVAGLIGDLNKNADEAHMENAYNYGAISVGTINSTGSGNNGRIYVGGLLCTQSNGMMTNCHNAKSATITVKPNNIKASETIVGGLVAYRSSTSIVDQLLEMNNCSNNADIEVAPEVAFGIYVGGCIAHSWASKTDLTNRYVSVVNNGKITVKGKDIGYTAGDDGTDVTLSAINAVGGFYGYFLSHAEFKDCHNNGEILIENTGKASSFQVGGFAGYMAHRIKTKHFEYVNCSNTKKITFKPAYVNLYARVGGFLGLGTSSANYVAPGSDTDIFTGCFNSGDLEVSGEGTINELWACSFVGYLSQGATFTNCYTAENTKVDIKAKEIKTNACSGWIGECRQHAGGDKYTLTNCSAKAITTYDSAVGGALRFTGLVGGNNALSTPSGSQTVTVSDCIVGGETHIHGTANTISYGGFVRYPYGAGSTYYFNRCTNDCDAYIDATTTSQIEAGGIGGYISATLIVDKDTKVTADFNFSGKTGSYLAYGGYWGNINHSTATDKYEGSHSGNITLTGTIGTNIVLGGIGAQHKAKINLDNTVNTGNIYLGTAEKSLTVGANADNYVRVGGISCGGATGYDDDNLVHSLNNVTNTGDIILENVEFKMPAERVWVGGIMGYASSSVTGATVHCKIQTGNIPNVGIVMGNARVADTLDDAGAVSKAGIRAIDCKVGGTILNEWNDEEQIYEGKTLNSSNFHNYIYGCGKSTDWTGTDNYDGCTLLTSKPTFN